MSPLWPGLGRRTEQSAISFQNEKPQAKLMADG